MPTKHCTCSLSLSLPDFTGVGKHKPRFKCLFRIHILFAAKMDCVNQTWQMCSCLNPDIRVVFLLYYILLVDVCAMLLSISFSLLCMQCTKMIAHAFHAIRLVSFYLHYIWNGRTWFCLVENVFKSLFYSIISHTPIGLLYFDYFHETVSLTLLLACRWYYYYGHYTRLQIGLTVVDM